MRYYGESNVPGAPGNFRTLEYIPARDGGLNFTPMPYYGGGMGVQPLAGGVDLPFGGGGRYKTIQEQFKPGAPKENIPIRVFPPTEPGREGAINVPFRLAQAYPGSQPLGNAAALGGQMMMQQMQGAPRELGQEMGPPIQFGVDIENEKVKSLRGNVNAQIDPLQRLNFGGQYNVMDQSGRFGIGYQTPTFGFDVNVTRTPRMPGIPGSSGGYGALMNMGGRF